MKQIIGTTEQIRCTSIEENNFIQLRLYHIIINVEK